MKTTIISMLVTGTLATTMLVGNPAVHASDMLASAQTAVNGANTHQIVTVLELYYSDNGQYPTVSSGQALISKLKSDGYIESVPLNSEDFSYSTTNSGQEYKLSLTK